MDKIEDICECGVCVCLFCEIEFVSNGEVFGLEDGNFLPIVASFWCDNDTKDEWNFLTITQSVTQRNSSLRYINHELIARNYGKKWEKNDDKILL